ncbi:hypothetical protein llap_586 [Limosa lapponica baueri]|uniref:Uncharacterized protein n=1 Tax=Limosa lapponica baueri TaxID=1758121 RepID=A0A2I0USW3_LIMLA|nr:hypothetical protein llap_586 [Limosa lapponica baueri]
MDALRSQAALVLDMKMKVVPDVKMNNQGQRVQPLIPPTLIKERIISNFRKKSSWGHNSHTNYKLIENDQVAELSSSVALPTPQTHEVQLFNAEETKNFLLSKKKKRKERKKKEKRKEEGGRRKEEGGRRKEEGGRRKEEGKKKKKRKNKKKKKRKKEKPHHPANLIFITAISF